jgi:FtsH-binding integral membrane protein
MSGKSWVRIGIIVVALVLLVALDAVMSLAGLPILLILLALALLATERLRLWLRARQRVGLSMLPFMSSALVLMFAFARGRDLSQAVLLIVTLAVVFDILLVALSLIGEASKRGLKGLAEFAGLAVVGLVLGFALSLAFVVGIGRPGGTSLAGP